MRCIGERCIGERNETSLSSHAIQQTCLHSHLRLSTATAATRYLTPVPSNSRVRKSRREHEAAFLARAPLYKTRLLALADLSSARALRLDSPLSFFHTPPSLCTPSPSLPLYTTTFHPLLYSLTSSCVCARALSPPLSISLSSLSPSLSLSLSSLSLAISLALAPSLARSLALSHLSCPSLLR
jgi:hypothetical protein